MRLRRHGFQSVDDLPHLRECLEKSATGRRVGGETEFPLHDVAFEVDHHAIGG